MKTASEVAARWAAVCARQTWAQSLGVPEPPPITESELRAYDDWLCQLVAFLDGRSAYDPRLPNPNAERSA